MIWDPFIIEEEKCLSWKRGKCNLCIDEFACVAFYWKDEGPQIDPTVCIGCGICTGVCPAKAITQTEGVKS
ncbi:4Fe-4S binding protein [Cytobacillus sp. Hz8]|uniref:4Fe-4S binding protein n=1 Tax=Cytobacillus sp. Hz8 TaxID=3347168 RepID=UPI0035DFCB9B